MASVSVDFGPGVRGARWKRREIEARRDILWHYKFLQRLLETGSVEKAASAAGLSSSVVAYVARRDNPDFRDDWEEIKRVLDERKADEIEAATAERAINGSKYTKYSPKGDVIEEGTTPDTSAAVAMLKAYRPERFKEKPEPSAGETLRTFTDLVRALNEERRARAALPPSEPALPETAVPPIEVKALPEGAAPPPLIRERVN